jgi:hypothetical protein
MGEKTNSKRYTGCACRCGQGTWGTYAPGHDSKHVAAMVRRVIEVAASPQGRYETAPAWRAAIRTLPTDALRAKFRRAMMRSATKHLRSIIADMEDERWQEAMHLQAEVCTWDNSYAFRVVSPDVLATVAAAMGMTRSSVNYSRS